MVQYSSKFVLPSIILKFQKVSIRIKESFIRQVDLVRSEVQSYLHFYQTTYFDSNISILILIIIVRIQCIFQISPGASRNFQYLMNNNNNVLQDSETINFRKKTFILIMLYLLKPFVDFTFLSLLICSKSLTLASW